jgi:hypothetical protein
MHLSEVDHVAPALRSKQVCIQRNSQQRDPFFAANGFVIFGSGVVRIEAGFFASLQF